MDLSLVLLQNEFAVCKLDKVQEIDWHDAFISLTKTADEVSLVCRVDCMPQGCTVNAPWRAFRVAGKLDFSLTGVLSRISAVLAESKISIFAISTYNTDYILVPAVQCGDAVSALSAAGYNVANGQGV